MTDATLSSEIVARLPATPNEERLWFEWQRNQSVAYVVNEAVTILEALDVAAWRRAVAHVVAHQCSLRTTFDDSTGAVEKIIWSSASEVELVVGRLEGRTSDERRAAAHARREAEARRPFDLRRLPLLRPLLQRVAADEWLFSFSVHHIIFDGSSTAILIDEIASAARDFASARGRRRAQASGIPQTRHREFTAAEKARRAMYWQGALASTQPPATMPTSGVATAHDRLLGSVSVDLDLPADICAALRKYCRAARRRPVSVFLAAVAILLARHANRKAVVVGVAASQRGELDVAKTIGFFVDTVPVAVELPATDTFDEVAATANAGLLDGLDNMLPLQDIIAAVQPPREAGRPTLFTTMLSYAPQGESSDTAFHIRREEPIVIDEPFDLTWVIHEYDAGFRLQLSFDHRMFDASTSLRFLERYCVLLRAALAEPRKRAVELDIMTAEDRVIALRPATPVTRPRDLNERIDEQIIRNADAVAIAGLEGNCSFGEFGCRVADFEQALISVRPGDHVAILMARSIDLIAAMVATMRRGAAFVPLDPAYPRARLDFIATDARIAAWIIHRRFAREVPAAHPIVADDLARSAQRIMSYNTTTPAAAPAYIIYTSGSTGTPKGVVITRSNVAAFVAWALDEFSRRELSKVLFSTSVSFDLSIFEVFVPLAGGTTCVVAADLFDLARSSAGDVSLVNTVPSLLREFLRVAPLPDGVEVAVLAGEPLAPGLVEACQTRERPRVINAYGPSEDTTYSTTGEARAGGGQISIGSPISGTSAYILDERLSPVPPGGVGELYLGGDGVASGYFGRPALTAARFLPDPFGPPGSRMYRTGDFVRSDLTGRLFFLGRHDDQRKIRGQRIELGEIETVLSQHETVDSAVALVVGDAGAETIVALVEGSAHVEPTDVREFVRMKLPRYMVPSQVVVVTDIPRLPNGKLDRRTATALADAATGPDTHRTASAGAEALPETAALIRGIWSELLPAQVPGLDDDFFDLGGHSLLVLRVRHELRTRLEADITLDTLFANPTIRELAPIVDLARRGASDQGTGDPPWTNRNIS